MLRLRGSTRVFPRGLRNGGKLRFCERVREKALAVRLDPKLARFIRESEAWSERTAEHRTEGESEARLTTDAAKLLGKSKIERGRTCATDRPHGEEGSLSPQPLKDGSKGSPKRKSEKESRPFGSLYCIRTDGFFALFQSRARLRSTRTEDFRYLPSAYFAACSPARRPNTTVSATAFPPRRLKPCTPPVTSPAA